MTDHLHEPYDSSAVLALSMCLCGWERPERTQTWRRPKTFTGIVRAAQYGRRMDIERVRE